MGSFSIMIHRFTEIVKQCRGFSNVNIGAKFGCDHRYDNFETCQVRTASRF